MWMAPEVFSLDGEREYSQTADVYAFGIIMWELATGLVLLIDLCSNFRPLLY